MKSIIYSAAIILAASTLTACGVKIKDYSEVEPIEKSVTVNEPFTAIEAFGMTDVKYSDGPASIKLYAPAELIDEIEVYVKNGTLFVGKRHNNNVSGNYKSWITVSQPGVNTFITSGTADFEIKNLNGTDIRMETSGTGDIECGTINCSTFSANSNGTGDIEIKSLTCGTAGLYTNGTGDIDIDYVNADTITGASAGTGDIDVKGECRHADLSKSGTGSINNGLKIKD